MGKYIKSELFRTAKTPMYKMFLVFSLVVTLLAMVFFKTITQNNVEADYLELMYLFATIAIMIVVSISMVLAFKTKDTKVQILSYGIRKEEMYFVDLISSILITLITVVLLGALAILSSFIGNKLGLVEVHGQYIDFVKYVGRMFLYTINITFQVFGLSYILNSTALGIVGSFVIIPMIMQMLVALTQRDIVTTLYTIQPYTLMNMYIFHPLADYIPEMWQNIGVSLVFTIVVYLIGGLVGFKKREIY